ncbi:MAG: uroporphyrinogen decarboxylase family protein [Ignavibacteria bacterium]|nr:uroporphyrinogen decarboxylase family protein [Ignavibacteria bacterium]
MTSRDRVIKALNHEEPDRIPIDLGGFQTGIHKRAYRVLIDHLGFDEEIQTLDPVQQLAIPSESVLQKFHADIRYVTAHTPDDFEGKIEINDREGRRWHDLRDEFGVVWSMPDDQMLYMDISHHPLANASLKNIESFPFPNGGDPSRFTGVREKALSMRQNTPYALSSGICGVTYEVCWYLRGMERWFLDTMENRAFCEALIDRTAQYWVEWMTGFLGEVGDVLDIIMIGDDLTGQDGPLFSPRFYREVVRPRQQRVINTIKKHSRAKIWYHTCGDCSEYIPDLIDMGIDILNPVQINTRGMDPKFLKAAYGNELVFWGGGIDSQRVLPFVSPEKIREEVRKNLEVFKPGGGYVFNNVHNIQPEVPPENIVAMYEAAYEFGFYV